MTTITFNADYAHILTKQGFVSTEATRYYLRGVYVHPCRNQPGAFLVATDGYRLGCFYDAEAVAPVPAIVSLSADALRMTKPHKIDKRVVRVEVLSLSEGPTRAKTGTVTLLDELGNVLCGRAGDVVDGTFPDWQRVVPSFPRPAEESPALVASYNAAYLAAFGFRDPESRASSGPCITIDQTDGSGPARVRNAHYPNFLGVVMPMRGMLDGDMLPAWYLDAPAPAAAAAE